MAHTRGRRKARTPRKFPKEQPQVQSAGAEAPVPAAPSAVPEMDYQAMGLDNGEWVMLVKEGYDNKVISPTVMMLMAERAAAR